MSERLSVSARSGGRVANRYRPDHVSPPGETLAEALQERDMTQAELARRTGRPKKTISEIINGKTAITPETALQLERALGIPARFWNNRQQQYDQHQVALQEEERLRRHVGWLERFSVKAMIDRSWIREAPDELGQLRELLNFLGIASPEQWDDLRHTKAVFRKTSAYESDPADVTAWLRRGEIKAQQIRCRPYNEARFKTTLVEDVRPLTMQPPERFVPELADLCAAAGVAVVFVPQLPRARVSGATRWLTPEKALLIPPEELQTFLDSLTPGRFPSTDDVRAFADRIGVAPGIVAGRLQHDQHVPFTHFNGLKQRLAWAGDVE